MNKKRNENGKRIFSFLLCFTLLFSQEVPVFADGLTGFSEKIFAAGAARTLSENGEEPAAFAGQQGRILTKPQDTQAGTSDSLTQPEETEMKPAVLRMPDFTGQSEEAEGELVEVGKHYKTWRMPDHTYKTVFTSYSNTYEEAGEEKLIDNTLVSGNGAGETYHNKANEIDVVLSAGEEEGAKLSVSANEVEAVMKPEDGNYANAAVSENAIRYNGVYENIDVQYTVQANGVKQDIILMAPQERAQFTYFLEKDGIYARLRDNCVYVYPKTVEDTVSGNEGTLSENSLDTPTIVISAPQMTDGAGSSSDQIVLALKELETNY